MARRSAQASYVCWFLLKWLTLWCRCLPIYAGPGVMLKKTRLRRKSYLTFRSVLLFGVLVCSTFLIPQSVGYQPLALQFSVLRSLRTYINASFCSLLGSALNVSGIVSSQPLIKPWLPLSAITPSREQQHRRQLLASASLMKTSPAG